ncbi:hypothetical protein F5Y05DRAFT_415260 [Hypoxylon sp. FL0543]|nr:hypothetical protein F5Y05DRAFT_415260 [Hypoxylon sp. FL0543]
MSSVANPTSTMTATAPLSTQAQSGVAAPTNVQTLTGGAAIGQARPASVAYPGTQFATFSAQPQNGAATFTQSQFAAVTGVPAQFGTTSSTLADETTMTGQKRQ